MANFVYIVMDEESREALLVDSGWETGPILAESARLGAKVKFAVATHEHFDHVTTLREAASSLGAEVVAHEDSPVECDVRVGDHGELKLGRAAVRVLHTPGHTEDSICLYDGREIFTGDTLFVGAIGRFDDGKGGAMFNSLHNVIMRLPPATMMYPGHDYGEVPSRSLGDEAANNPYLGTKELRSFLSLFS